MNSVQIDKVSKRISYGMQIDQIVNSLLLLNSQNGPFSMSWPIKNGYSCQNEIKKRHVLLNITLISRDFH